jgi:tRNA threonylcarbamoyl adenosine modification protein YeaZ
VNDEAVLAIETSSPHGSVALGRGACLLAHRRLTAVRKHTGELLPAIRKVLAVAGCQAREVGTVCFSQGPGSFTGLRVAATIARMWHSAHGCRVVAVSSLEVIARNALLTPDLPACLAVILDARHGKVFGATFAVRTPAPADAAAAATDLEPLEPPDLRDAAAWLPTITTPAAVMGDGVEHHRDTIAAAGLTPLPAESWIPDAREVLAIGRSRAAAGLFCSPHEIVPAYLRPPECEEVYEKRRAAARARRGE